jgi:hypothetical protein
MTHLPGWGQKIIVTQSSEKYDSNPVITKSNSHYSQQQSLYTATFHTSFILLTQECRACHIHSITLLDFFTSKPTSHQWRKRPIAKFQPPYHFTQTEYWTLITVMWYVCCWAAAQQWSGRFFGVFWGFPSFLHNPEQRPDEKEIPRKLGD